MRFEFVASLIFALLGVAIGAFPSAVRASGDGGTQPISSVGFDSTDALATLNSGTQWGNPDHCGISTFVVLQTSNPYYRDMLSLAATAVATGQSVALWLSGCVNTPWGNAPIVAIITVY